MKRIRLPTPKIVLPSNPVGEKVHEASQDLKVPDQDIKEQFLSNWDKAMKIIDENNVRDFLIRMIVSESDHSKIIVCSSPETDDNTYYTISNQYFDEQDFYDKIIRPWKGDNDEQDGRPGLTAE